jgi:hypothetical protein
MAARPSSVAAVRLVAFSLLSSSAGPADAAPQLNVGVAPGVDWRPDSKVAFDGSVAADVMFGRTGDASFGLGPRLELGTRAFDDLRLGAGLSAQLPTDPVAVVGTLQGLLQTNDGSLDPGIGARCFVGLRPYNHYGFYSAAIGLSLGADHVFGADATSVVAAVHIDGMWLSLPFLFLFNTATH